jgi:hypothetical protein
VASPASLAIIRAGIRGWDQIRLVLTDDVSAAFNRIIWGATMRTTILAYVMAVVGLITIIAGTWALLLLSTAAMPRVPLRYYAMAIGMVSGGLGMVGLAQALRLLILIHREALKASRQ